MIDETASPIVVGISRRTGSVAALRWAVTEAAARRTWVLAVTAWRPPRAPALAGGRPPVVSSTAESAGGEQQELSRQLTTALGGELASFAVRFELRTGTEAAVLLEAAHGAQLLVLDSPRAGDVTTVAKTWIVPQIVFRSPCPVVLMPPVH